MLYPWSVSSAIAEESLSDRALLEPERLRDLTWTEIEAGPSGLLNLARVQGIGPGASTCLASTILVATEATLLPLELGYSDRVRLYLNGRPLYSGDNGYRTRDYRHLGTIGFFDRVVLPLRAGPNRLDLAVSESFGGWGLMARVPALPGLRIVSTPVEEGPR